MGLTLGAKAIMETGGFHVNYLERSRRPTQEFPGLCFEKLGASSLHPMSPNRLGCKKRSLEGIWTESC